MRFACLALLTLLPAFVCAADAASASAAPASVPAPAFDPKRPHLELVTNKGTITAELFADECPHAVAVIAGLANGTKPFTDADGKEVTRPFYDGLTFHRVIAGFMIQGGCPKGDGSGGPGFRFPDEINAASLGLDKAPAMVGEELDPRCAYQMREFTKLFVWPRMQAKGVTKTTPADERAKLLKPILEELHSVTLQQFYEKLGYHYDATLPASHQPVRGSLAMANSGPDTNGSQFFINVGDTPHLAGKHSIIGRVIAGMEVVDAIAKVAVGFQDKPEQPVVITSMRVQVAPTKP
jgi:peptidyl-prolyl cis-trans isomerase A (cyclophilin A)